MFSFSAIWQWIVVFVDGSYIYVIYGYFLTFLEHLIFSFLTIRLIKPGIIVIASRLDWYVFVFMCTLEGRGIVSLCTSCFYKFYFCSIYAYSCKLSLLGTSTSTEWKIILLNFPPYQVKRRISLYVTTSLWTTQYLDKFELFVSLHVKNN